MSSPYRKLPRSAYWKSAVSALDAGKVDPVTTPKFTIDKSTAMMTAGSCFAANVTRYLVRFGYNYLFTERLHPFFAQRNAALEKRTALGEYSAGYGNIYTPRQMLQLLDRAYGRFSPKEDRWSTEDGAIVDVFRTMSEFPARSHREFEALREQHFVAVRKAVESCDVFVFTYGLTEAWVSKEDGTVFPVCPGVVAGDFDPERHEFKNFTVREIAEDTERLIHRLRELNPSVKVLLTVSPVPLVATASGKHVLTATVYSKSVLRAAAGEVADRFDCVDYFPSYEIVTGPQATYDAFEADRRAVSSAAIDGVMRVFFKNIAQDADAATALATSPQGATLAATRGESAPQAKNAATSLSEMIAAAECEEELLNSQSRE